MSAWHKLCITDKTGAEFFKCTASPTSTMSEIRNLKRHIEQAKANPSMYYFLYADSAVILLDGAPYSEPVSSFDADELLAELGL